MIIFAFCTIFLVKSIVGNIIDGRWKPCITQKQSGKKFIQRAWTDPDFKALLIADSRKALKQFDINLPAHIELKVVEEKPDLFYLVIPVPPDIPPSNDAWV